MALAVALLVALVGCGTGESQGDFAFRITYQAVPPDGASPSREEMDLVQAIIERRLEATGVASLRVSLEEPDRVVVEAAPASVIEVVRALAGVTGRLDFVPLGSTPMSSGEQVDFDQFPSLFSGDQLAGATIGTDQTGQRTLDLVLKDEGRRLLADYTRDHVGDSMAIVLDGQVLVAPVILESIPNGEVQITAGDTDGYPLGEAQNLVTILKFGQHPFPLREIQVEQR